MKYVYKFIMDDGITFDAGTDTDPKEFREELTSHYDQTSFMYLECRDANERLVTFDFRPASVKAIAIIPQETIAEANKGPILHRAN